MRDHLLAQSDLSGAVEQKVLKVKRTAFSWGKLNADVIVSNVVPSWRSLPAFSALRAMHLDTRLVHVEHSYTRAFTTLNVPYIRRFFAMLRVIYSFFDQVVAVSHAQSDWMKERRLATSEKLTVIPPTVDLEQLSRNMMPPKSKTTIGAIERLEQQKGFDILIQGFRSTRTPGARLLPAKSMGYVIGKAMQECRSATLILNLGDALSTNACDLPLLRHATDVRSAIRSSNRGGGLPSLDRRAPK